ncbi:ABC transporter permease [Bifidobacterium sp.]|jgi:ABC-2 type transport system permease protein|uniref:ABC transporter permease n=1 Tax=Bifidobacterium sp. TaxID=41200 RepID=UPI0025BED966|nr:hypothetical protein [Bifidobacterium sp.]MCH4208800.1 hypothetical protein [Bifidobacterium sp.]MCI1224758.1 hypothetical protein [Bifidobacterium sp.]
MKQLNQQFESCTTLLVQYLRRDWKKILVWVLGLGLFCSVYVPAFEEVAQGNGHIGMFVTMGNPAMIALVGPTPVTSAADYTVGAMYAHEMLLFCSIMAMVVSILHVVGHTRREEDLGLSEMIRAFPVGRQASSLAVIIETVGINIVLGVFTAAVMASFHEASIRFAGSMLFGLSLSAAGILGTAIALVFAQVMPTASGASGASLGVLGALYILRAASDVSNETLSLINPLGSTYLTYPMTQNRWWVLFIALGYSAALFVIAALLENGRDMTASYIPERLGLSHARRGLLSVHGLLLRLNRGIIIAWLVAFACLGAAYGSIYGDMSSFLNSNQLMKSMFADSGVSLEASFTSTILIVLSGLAAILPIVVVNKLYAEETRLHLAQLMSTQVSRGRLFWTNTALAFICAVLGTLFTAGTLGAAALSSASGQLSIGMGDFLAAGFNQLPIMLIFVGLAALLLGLAPQLGKAAYGYLTYAILLSYFGNILDLPQWVMKTSPLNWMPRMPVESFDSAPFLLVAAAAIAMTIIGAWGYSRRDMHEGA